MIIPMRRLRRPLALWSVAVLGTGVAAVTAWGDSERQRAGSAQHYLVAQVTRPSAQGLLAIVGPTGEVERIIDQGRQLGLGAAWSPDRSMIAWISGDTVYVERTDGTGRRKVALKVDGSECHAACLPLELAWSPDGRRVAVSALDFSGRQRKP